MEGLVEEAEGINSQKKELLESKDEKIKTLKEEIEFMENKISRDKNTEMTEAQELEFLMEDQREASIVPISKLSEPGVYLFGTKKMFVQILEHELMVRVGGGYVDINEYLIKYTDTELTKINKQLKKEQITRYEDLEIYQDLVIKHGLQPKDEREFCVPTLIRDQ